MLRKCKLKSNKLVSCPWVVGDTLYLFWSFVFCAFLCLKFSIIDIYILCCAQSLSRVQLFTTPWVVAHQAPLSMELSKQEYWSKLPFPSPGDLPNPGIECGSPSLQADSLPFEPPGKCHLRSPLPSLMVPISSSIYLVSIFPFTFSLLTVVQASWDQGPNLCYLTL